MAKRIMWKNILGLPKDNSVQVYIDRTSQGYFIKVKNYVSGWSGWTFAEAEAGAAALQAAGINAEQHRNWRPDMTRPAYAQKWRGRNKCVLYFVAQDEKEAALNKLTKKERDLLGV